MNGPTVPDTTEQIFSAVRPQYYSRDGKLMDPLPRSYTVLWLLLTLLDKAIWWTTVVLWKAQEGNICNKESYY